MVLEEEGSVFPGFSAFVKVEPDENAFFSFKDFFQVFLLGDLRHILALSPFGYARSVADDLDPALTLTDERRLKYLGDPIKTAMLVQILRAFPYIVSIPAIFSLSLFIAAFSKFLIPFIRRFSTLIGQLVDNGGNRNSRKKRDAHVTRGGIELIPGHLKKMAVKLNSALDGVQFLALQHAQNDSTFNALHLKVLQKRSSRFAGYNERKARMGISEVSEVGLVVRSWIRTWITISPSIADCVGTLIGCYVRLAYWASACKPFATVTSCVSILGRSLGIVATTATKFLND